MDSIKGQGGIQMLLTAEQEAQQIIARARDTKISRLKQAKDEADREVAAYRAHLEIEYQKKISQSIGNSGSAMKLMEEETEIRIQRMKDETGRNFPEVVSMIMKNVMTVNS